MVGSFRQNVRNNSVHTSVFPQCLQKGVVKPEAKNRRVHHDIKVFQAEYCDAHQPFKDRRKEIYVFIIALPELLVEPTEALKERSYQRQPPSNILRAKAH